MFLPEKVLFSHYSVNRVRVRVKVRVRVRVRVRVSTGGKSQGMPRKRQQSPQRVMREGY